MSETHHTTLGILGGGQLGRMSAQAAKKPGIRTVIYTPEENSPASQVADETVIGQYEDETALTQFSEKVDVISYEFENIPVETVRYLKALKPVYPDEKLLEVSQDRIEEKTFLNSIDIPTAPWAAPKSPKDIESTLAKWNDQSCILKTTRFGYDGKGQARIPSASEIETIWTQFNGAPLIMEGIIDFDCEISVIVARDKDGNMVHYGPMLNDHENHILSKTTVPSNLEASIEEQAVKLTKRLAEKVDLRGVLTLELFVTKGGQLLANEIAPRTHNSGHWSIDACEYSQFENHVRAVCGLPVAEPDRHSNAEMINLIGADIEKASKYEGQSNIFIHDYGKSEVREGRKMGHITTLKS